MGSFRRSVKKGLKELSGKSKSIVETIYFSDLYDTVTEPYNKVRRVFKKCKKLVEFIPEVWKHEDWDYGYIFRFNEYLHKRLYKGIYIEGHHVERKQDKVALKVIIELYKRLQDDSNMIEGHKVYFDKKWGRDVESPFTFKKVLDPASGKVYTTLHDPVTDRLTPEELAQYRKEQKALYKFEDEHYNRHVAMLNRYIARYHKRFWD